MFLQADYEGRLERTPIVPQILIFENLENPEKVGEFFLRKRYLLPFLQFSIIYYGLYTCVLAVGRYHLATKLPNSLIF